MARRPRVAIVGLGLVGGSLARALTAAGYRVTGIDWPLVVRRALRTRAIAAGATRTEAGGVGRRRGPRGAPGHEPPAPPPAGEGGPARGW